MSDLLIFLPHIRHAKQNILISAHEWAARKSDIFLGIVLIDRCSNNRGRHTAQKEQKRISNETVICKVVEEIAAINLRELLG